MRLKNPIEIKEGLELTIDTLSWQDGWEFDHPSMIISPVIRCHEDGAHHETLVESLCIDAVVDGVLKDEDFEAHWAWRGYKLPVLRRRFRGAMAGKRFPVACYHAERTVVRFIQDPDGDPGELTWEEKGNT